MAGPEGEGLLVEVAGCRQAIGDAGAFGLAVEFVEGALFVGGFGFVGREGAG